MTLQPISAKRQKTEQDNSTTSPFISTMVTAKDAEKSPLFQERLSAGRLVVTDPPKFDLESYIQHYDGRTRLDRLIHIGTTSTFLSIDALRLAVQQAEKGIDINKYLQAVEALQKVAPNDPLAQVDPRLVDGKMKSIRAEGEKLERELKGYRNNLIKESIRMGNEDLGKHYYAAGDLPESWKAFQRMRDYCTSLYNISDMLFHMILNAIQQSQWQLGLSQLIKVNAQNWKAEEKAEIDPVIRALSGLCQMELENFREAAIEFMATKFTYGTVEKAGQVIWNQQVLTQNDIAVYGGLCALASMDREQLQHWVLDNAEFRQFLELEPHIRRAITLFCSSKYTACLDVLESYRADYLLDYYLQPVLNSIYGMVRSKSIVQYFIPFSCVTLDEMTSAFQTSEGLDVENELVRMIERGQLNARVDLSKRLLLAPQVDARHSVHQKAIKAAESYEHTLRLRLVRLNMLSAGLDIKKSHGGGGGNFQHEGIEDNESSFMARKGRKGIFS